MVDKSGIIDAIKSHAEEMRSLGIARVGVFGSMARDEARADSDVDLLVEFVPGRKKYRSFVKSWELLETIAGRPVDVVTPEALSPYIKPHVDRDIVYVKTS